MSDIVPVPTIDGLNLHDHLRDYHGIDLPTSASKATLIKVHQAHHFQHGLGRVPMPKRHYHSERITKLLDKIATEDFERRSAEMRARAGLI